MSKYAKFIVLTGIGIGLLPAIMSGTMAQSVSPTTQAADLSADQLITLNFPDNLELKTLIEYVSERLSFNVLYDEQVVAQRLTLKTPARVPKSSLMGLLQSALKLKGLILVDGEQPGWKRVVPITGMIATARTSTQPVAFQNNSTKYESGQALTQVFALRFADVAKFEALIKPFLTQPGGNSLPLPEQHLLIVTDFAVNVQRIAELLALIDQPQPSAEVRFVNIQHVQAQTIAGQVTQMFAARLKQQHGAFTADTMDVLADTRTNRLALVGPTELMDIAEALVHQLDVPLDLQTHYYTFKSASADRIDHLARELIKPMDPGGVYQSVIDKDANLMIVTGTAPMQEKIAQLAANLDLPLESADSPIRFYKLSNATAADVLETIRALTGETGTSTPASSVPSVSGTATGGLGINPGGTNPMQPSGPNIPPAAPGQAAPTPPSYHEQPSSAGTPGSSPTALPASAGGAASSSASASSAPRESIRTKDASITSDPNTNTIIVVAPASIQSFYQRMIESLDKRRPQVLVECTIVTLDTANEVTFGVEMGGDTRTGNTNVVTFSSFGLSTPNTSNGQLALTPGTGFNLAMLKPDVGSIILQALATSGKAQVLSAPKILVNDNATGTLSSVQEDPYTSVNASQTVSTTSFAGYASAGTTITLTPHISEGDHLNLEYSVQLNTFSGEGSNGIPPPRQTDSLDSTVTIPDGEMIVVGGLNRHNTSHTESGIPLLRLIPVLGALFSDRDRQDEKATLFVFIHPVILRDDQFQDLKYYSQRDRERAGVSDSWPHSDPLVMH